MSMYNVTADPDLTLNLRTNDVTGLVAHVQELEFKSGTKLTPDMKIKNPEAPTGDVTVLGPLVNKNWTGVQKDPFTVTGYLSQENAGLLSDAISKPDGGMHVTIKYMFFRYDYTAKKFTSLYGPEKALICTVLNKDSYVSPTPYGTQNPPIFEYMLKLQPAGEQEVLWAPTASAKNMVKIGVTTGAAPAA